MITDRRGSESNRLLDLCGLRLRSIAVTHVKIINTEPGTGPKLIWITRQTSLEKGNSFFPAPELTICNALLGCISSTVSGIKSHRLLRRGETFGGFPLVVQYVGQPEIAISRIGIELNA